VDESEHEVRKLDGGLVSKKYQKNIKKLLSFDGVTSQPLSPDCVLSGVCASQAGLARLPLLHHIASRDYYSQ